MAADTEGTPSLLAQLDLRGVEGVSTPPVGKVGPAPSTK
jgi:hypothetical protein